MDYRALTRKVPQCTSNTQPALRYLLCHATCYEGLIPFI